MNKFIAYLASLLLLFFMIFASNLFADNPLSQNTTPILLDTETEAPLPLASDSATEFSVNVYAEYLLAAYFQEKDDMENSIIELKKAIELMPDDANLQLRLAQSFYLNKELDPALDTLKLVKQLSPDDADAYLLTGKIYVLQNKPLMAIPAYTKATALAPKSWESYFQLAQLYQELNQYDDAVTTYQEAAQLKSDDFLSSFRLGYLLAQKGKYPDAIKYYRKTIDLAPRYLLAYLHLGLIYDITGNTNDAISTYRAAIAVEPSVVDLHQRLGSLYLREDKYADAIPEFQTVLAQDSENAAARFSLGEACFSSQQFAAAQQQFELLTDNKKFGVRSQYYLALIAEAQQKYTLALSLYTSALPYDKNTTDKDEVYLHLYRLFKQANNLPEAIQYYQNLLLDQKMPIFYLYLSWANADLEQWEKAKSINLEGIQQFPQDEDLVYQMGIIYDKLNQIENAASQFKRVIELNPQHVDAYNYLGFMYAEKEINLDEAEGYIRKALALAPDAGYILDSLGWVHYKQGKYEFALTELKKAASITSTDAVIYEHLGDTYRALSSYKEARDAWKKALELDPKNDSLRRKIESTTK
jgi:tetratricopeptide (TPR) repeat protein